MSVKSAKNTIAGQQFKEALGFWFANSGLKQKDASFFLGLTQGALSGILTGRETPSLANMEGIADKLNTNLADMLAQGRSILAPGSLPLPFTLLPAPKKLDAPLPVDEIDSDYFKIPFRDDMRLAAGTGAAPEGFYETDASPVVIHKSLIRRHSSANLKAFRVGGDSMEPTIRKNGIVVVDMAQNEWKSLKDKGIYVIHLDDEAAVKRLRWVKQGETLAVISDSPSQEIIYRKAAQLYLHGRVIWSWGEH